MKHLTIELTRRRDFTLRSPDQLSCETRSATRVQRFVRRRLGTPDHPSRRSEHYLKWDFNEQQRQCNDDQKYLLATHDPSSADQVRSLDSLSIIAFNCLAKVELAQRDNQIPAPQFEISSFSLHPSFLLFQPSKAPTNLERLVGPRGSFS